MYTGIVIMIRAFASPSTKSAVSFPVNSLSSFPVNTSNTLYIVSNGQSVSSVMARITAQLGNITYREFATESAAASAYAAQNESVAATVIFGYNDNSTLQQYAIRMPASSVADTKSMLAGDQGNCVCVAVPVGERIKGPHVKFISLIQD